MVRGWVPSVEEALGEIVGVGPGDPARAHLSRSIPRRLSDPHRRRGRGQGRGLPGGPRGSRRPRRPPVPARRPTPPTGSTSRPTGSARSSRLSEAVPVFENFGFRVLDEVPTPVGRGGATGYVHDFDLQMPGDGDASAVLKRATLVEQAIADVLEGKAENDPFNQLIVSARLDPREIMLFRAWFRYLRQTGLSYSLVTVVDALRRAPEVTKGLIALFDAMHDPARGGAARRSGQGGREEDRQGPRRRRGDRRGPHLAPDPRRHRGDAAHQRLRAVGRRGARLQARIRAGARPAGAGAVARDLGLFAQDRGHPPARRPDRARRPPMVRPARRFPHRGARPDEGAGGQECGDRADRRQGRLLRQAIAARLQPRRLVRRRDRSLSDLHPLAAFGHRQYRRAARSSIPRASPSATPRIPISSSPPTRARRPSPTSPTRSRSSAASGSATPSPAAAPTATTTRRWGSPPRAPASARPWPGRHPGVVATLATLSPRARIGGLATGTAWRGSPSLEFDAG